MRTSPLAYFPSAFDATEFQQADGSGERAPVAVDADAVRGARVGQIIHQVFVPDFGPAQPCGRQIVALDVAADEFTITREMQ